MAIVDGLRANAANVNPRLMSRTTDTSTVGEIDLENVTPASGATVVNVQREINSLNAYTGRPASSAHNATPAWVSNQLGSPTNTLKGRLEAVDAAFADLRPYVVDASVAGRGLVSTGTQSFAGNKTFTGTLTASNLSGSNTGDVTVGVIGATPNANGLTLTAQVLNLEPASATFGGVLSAVAQSVAGVKTFVSGVVSQTYSWIQGQLRLDSENNAATGANQTLATPTKVIVRLTGAITSIEGITAPAFNMEFILVNVSGAAVDLLNATGTAANQIITGTAATLSVANGAAARIFYDLTSARWRIGGGSGGGGSAKTVQSFTSTTITLTSSPDQTWRFTSGTPTTISGITHTAAPDGARITIMNVGSEMTLAPTASGIQAQNGTWVSDLGGVIVYEKYSTFGLVEVSRNGL